MKKVILWFRQDLRVRDNPALVAAVQAGQVMPVYILDDEAAGPYKAGAASRWFLHHALADLDRALGGRLNFYRGRAAEILPRIAARHRASGLYWNRCYEPWRVNRDRAIKEDFLGRDIACHSFNASLLWEPWESLKQDGTPYRVFTPFYKNLCQRPVPPRLPFAKPERIDCAPRDKNSLTLDGLGLLPGIRWDRPLIPHWGISEDAAHARLQDFIDGGLHGYKTGRDFPGRNYSSGLSPYLHHGLISPHTVRASVSRDGDGDDDVAHFMRELGWREFSNMLLYYNPSLPCKNLQGRFDGFPWRTDDAALRRWQAGQTGYPIIDAGMRELWQTGFMHNRVRMLVASFLVKNLLIDWRLGQEWFWDCLVDADLANNSTSWQWVAGSGADAAPYFRVFNPVTQAVKFDPDGDYIRRFVPELARLPTKHLFAPWDAPDHVLKESRVILGKTYPDPIVNLAASRDRALAAFHSLR